METSKWQLYKELELIPDSVTKPGWVSWKGILRSVWKFAVHVLADRSEPQIREKIDQDGRPYWRVYDPLTRQSCYFTTQTEVREWLEHRYRRAHHDHRSAHFRMMFYQSSRWW